ncbi:P-loop containing nucleoside triphosphate hydrolase protein [Phlegmacium glaucopus]|nr:P-loop containing nucleoside triphosphate hydrolase protein [Phlegmacium glaucopus]
MADGKKRRNAGKPLPPTAAAIANPMKQKTLFDSFLLKNRAKIATGQLSESRDLTHSGTTVESAGHIGNASSLSNIIDLTKARTKSPSPFIEDNLVDTAREGRENTNGARIVPSVIVVADDDDAGVSVATGSLKLSDTSQFSVACEGKSADQPIIIPASPLKAPSTSISSGADKPAHPFFMSKPRTFTQPFPSKTSSPKHVAKVAPYPDHSSQHVKGLQTPLQNSSPSIFPCRKQRAFEQSLDDSTSYAFLKQKDTRDYLPATLPSFPIVQSRPPELNRVPDEHAFNHPAVTRFMNKIPENLNLRSRRPWSEKWRPSCAQEVLGNEKSATYLRDWLRALELQLEDGRTAIPPEAKDIVPKGTAKAPSRGIKRPRVVRAVERTRGRKKLRHNSDDEDDWIVYTDEESDEDVSTHPEVDIYGDLIPEPLASLESSQNSDVQALTVGNVGQDLGQLHNTILLTGPHGNGKTAAVYACAEELDWDVFEVYPGIGKRNGASLSNYIGEVGKNHLVHQSHRNSGDFLRSLFLRPREDIDVANGSPSGDETDADIQDQSPKPVKPIRQSLILLEEVDILFKEDNNFWNTVTGIIKECKRPVVCTCNDISLVPVHDLPLQAVLEFKPCPTDLAVSYLQNLCSAEGYFVEPGILSQLYTRSALSSEALQSAPDLRKTIHALQVVCLPTTETRCNETMPPPATKTSLGGIEFLSYMDSYLSKDPSQVFVIEELASYVPSNDDEIGHCILYDTDAKDEIQVGRQEEISSWARQILGVDVTREGYRKREYELRRMVGEVCPIWVWSRGDGSIYMDYVPLIRQIVEADDAQEEAEMKGRGGRATRNSTRAHGYVRSVMLTAEGRTGLIW